MKTGLVLEGGAMRGMYTAGVLDVLMENNIEFDGIIGVSAGACFGCNYKSRQIGRTIRYNKRFCKDSRYMGLKSLVFTGDLYNEKFCYGEVPKKYDVFDTDTFSKTPVEFFVVATDVKTGKPVYHKCTDGGDVDIKWMQASASMPLVSRIVKIDDMELLDGGVSDSVPIEWFRENGYKRNLVVLTRPKGYRKAKTGGIGLMRLMFRKYPAVIKAMIKRPTVYNETLDRLSVLEKEGETFVLYPSENIDVKRVERNAEKLEKAYRLGRSDADAKLDEIKKFLYKE